MRTIWTAGFPDVVVHSVLARRDGHPCYGAAKSGNAEAALTLVGALLDDDATTCLKELLDDRDALLLPVVAEEFAGFNAIPDAMAQALARRLGLIAVAGEIVQANKVGHTRAPAFQRLVTPAAFAGPVESGARYVLVDDHVGLGGTLANLKGHIELEGGTVIAMTTLTQSRDAQRISLCDETRIMLWDKHGEDLDRLWSTQFGYGIDCLTQVEALQLCRQPSVAAIEDFLAKAAVEVRGRGLDPAL